MINRVKIFGIAVVALMLFSMAIMSSCESLNTMGSAAGSSFAYALGRDASAAIVGGISQSLAAGESEASIRRKITSAVDQAYPDFIGSFSNGVRLVVLGSSTSEANYADYAVEDMEYNLIQAGFRLVDRRQIDLIRAEQNFQLSGDVDDASAVNIGKMTGAEYVIVIGISYSDRSGRLTLKGLDVETGEIVTMARQQI
jgi:hypothetical protein